MWNWSRAPGGPGYKCGQGVVACRCLCRMQWAWEWPVEGFGEVSRASKLPLWAQAAEAPSRVPKPRIIRLHEIIRTKRAKPFPLVDVRRTGKCFPESMDDI